MRSLLYPSAVYRTRGRSVLMRVLLGGLISVTAIAPQNLTDSQVRERIAHLEERLDAGRADAQIWWWGWLGGYSALTVAQVGIYVATPDDTEDNRTLRDIMLVGAASSAIGVAWQLVGPFPAADGADAFRHMRDNTDSERRLKLAAAERQMRRAAEAEEFGKSWWAHAAGFSVNLAAGLIIWQAMHHTFTEGFINFAAGMVISEAQIYTQPAQAITDELHYRQRYGVPLGAQARRSWFIAFGGTRFVAGFYF